MSSARRLSCHLSSEGPLAYSACFPLPYDLHLHDRVYVLRLDRMEPIRKENLCPLDIRLSREWLLYVQEWARFYITVKGRPKPATSGRLKTSHFEELAVRHRVLSAVPWWDQGEWRGESTQNGNGGGRF